MGLSLGGGFLANSYRLTYKIASNVPKVRTGRTVATNEFEAKAMKQILENPALGTRIDKLSPMVDKSGRWNGWSKMYYNYLGEGGKKFQIHFNAAFDEAGKMIKVDDFKFKDH
jgi:hypothetical protein